MTSAPPASAAGKKAARVSLKQARAALGASERAHIDTAIAAQVFARLAWQNARHVLTYLSVGDEVDTRALVKRAWRTGKAVAVPRCVPGARLMTWHRIASFDELVRAPFGIDEPPFAEETRVDPAALPAESTLALVPGLAFDRAGMRLGYGGGFYDAFLASFAGTSMGLCRAAFLIDSLAAEGLTEPQDRPVNLVATQHGVCAANS